MALRYRSASSEDRRWKKADKHIITVPNICIHLFKEVKKYSDQKTVQKDQTKKRNRNFSVFISLNNSLFFDKRLYKDNIYKTENTI